MLDTIAFFFFLNIFLISGLFWLLSFVGEKFFKKKHNRYAEELFECGFLVNHTFNLRININLFFIFNLLILYDVEFLFLIPFFYNVEISSLFSTWVFSGFFYFIIATLFLDWSYVSMIWHN